MRETIKYFCITALACVLLFSLAEYRPAVADTGREGATRKEIGSYMDIASVNGSSVAGTALFAASVSRPDGAYFNNTASVIWLGTTTATQDGVVHSNIANGFPVLSSATFSLDGSMSGTLSFTCNAGIATCNIRRLEGLVR